MYGTGGDDGYSGGHPWLCAISNILLLVQVQLRWHDYHRRCCHRRSVAIAPMPRDTSSPSPSSPGLVSGIFIAFNVVALSLSLSPSCCFVTVASVVASSSHVASVVVVAATIVIGEARESGTPVDVSLLRLRALVTTSEDAGAGEDLLHVSHCQAQEAELTTRVSIRCAQGGRGRARNDVVIEGMDTDSGFSSMGRVQVREQTKGKRKTGTWTKPKMGTQPRKGKHSKLDEIGIKEGAGVVEDKECIDEILGFSSAAECASEEVWDGVLDRVGNGAERKVDNVIENVGSGLCCSTSPKVQVTQVVATLLEGRQ
ncbi:hypothetical protein EDB86DRAFT_2826611 [Lactarius hatsudake]|nr:hypothetical protein EDB86DRAFT_2826611 [Lactarius hatsudake]